MDDGGKDARPIGRDEMNLAEFPIALLTNRASKKVKTLVFEGKDGKLTVTGSDLHGLPTAPDADVILGLIQLTKLRNGFTDPNVTFSKYELLKLLGWDDQGRHYRRLDESLNRWMGVTLYYEKAWWDNSIKCKVDAKFHILESVLFFDHEVRRTLMARQQTLPLSSFTWNKVFLKSCQDDNLKRLDLETYFSLRSAVSKQLYRFLDKRFYMRDEWMFDLKELAFDHVGLSRGYTAAKVKEKLKPALDELERIGFLLPATTADRYANVARGEWRIRLARQVVKLSAVPDSERTVDLEHELIVRGVTATTAREVVRDFSEEKVRAQIEHVDWIKEKKPGRVKDLGAYLVKAIRDDYAPPAGFESQADRSRRIAADQERLHQDQERRNREAAAKVAEREADEKVRLFWEGLTADEQVKVEAEALATADQATRSSCMDGPAVMRKVLLRVLREDFVRNRLDLPSKG